MAANSPLKSERVDFADDRGFVAVIFGSRATESVPSPARKMTTVAIRVVARLKRRRERSARTSTWLLRERRSIPPLTGARKGRPLAAITA